MNNLDFLFEQALVLSQQIKELEAQEAELREQIKSILTANGKFTQTARTRVANGFYAIKARDNFAVNREVVLRMAGDDLQKLKLLANIAQYKPTDLMTINFSAAVTKKEPTYILEIRNDN